MVYRPCARIVEVENGYAIKYVDNLGKECGWFSRYDGKPKVWQRIEGAQRVMKKYGFMVG